MAAICALAVVLAGVAVYGWHVGWFAKSTSNGNTTTPQTSQTSALPRADVPSPKKNDDPAAQAQRAVSAMTLEERVGQLVMVPLFAGSDPSSLASTIADEHIGSAILIGNWNTGVDTVKTATAQLRICAGRQSSHHRHRSGGWSGAASDWYRFRHNAQCR